MQIQKPDIQNLNQPARAHSPSATQIDLIDLFKFKPGENFPTYIFAKRSIETPDECIRRYCDCFNKDPLLGELMGCCLDFPFDEKSAIIEYFNVSDCAQNSCHYRVGLIANHKIDMCCDPWRVRLFQESFCGLQAEVLTIPIAPTIGLNDLEAQEYYRKLNQIIDVAIFAGGDDIDPELFSQKNYQSKSVNALRDVHEQLLLFSFLRSEKTFVAGVCRGHQLILSTLIEDCCLIQDLSKDLGISDHDDGTHKIEYITTAPFIDAFYHSIPELISNSLHHQAFIDLPHDGPVVVNACDSHGIIEGTVFKNLRGMTVQFHPEKMPYVANAFARSLLQGAQSLRAHPYT